MGKRRRARELALKKLYQWDFHGSGEAEPWMAAPSDRTDSRDVVDFARGIFEGVLQNREEIDRLIESHSRHWKLYRMSRIDRNILRIAIYEFLHCEDIPPKVSIDEAIEIGKRFGTTESGPFINGILDQVCKRLGRIAGAGGEEKHEGAGNGSAG